MLSKPEILQLGAAALRQHASPVDDFKSGEFHDLLHTLHEMMQENNGVGIAAPQLGIGKQIVIVASRPTARYPHAPDMPPVVMINPYYEIVDRTIVKDWEGCLSVPGIRALVPRFRAIRVYYQEATGTTKQLLLQDFPARVFQHEYDHLLGLVYLDRVENNRDIVSESEFYKLIAA